MKPLSPTRSSGLDAIQCESFHRDGVLHPIDVMTEHEAKALRAQIEALEARKHGRLSGLVRAKPHLLMPYLWDVIHDPRIVDRVSSLLGEDILCIGSSVIDKPAHSDGYVAWHQDATFWGLDENNGATAWLALSDATTDSGAMQAIPGTHARQLRHLDTGDAKNMLGAREAVDAQLDLSQAVWMTLKAGQMSLHHPQVLHGSGPNTSDDRRLGFAIRYTSARVRQEGGTATLVRGENLAQVPLEIRPEAEMAAPALARHADIIRQGGKVIRNAKNRHFAEVNGQVDHPQ
ncbi:hypothetical protein BOO69_14150 [Sulfitobacter alexandrii]|uniref:Phytanoyl-CoA dioxygenase family protein n=1 Tax=Sulfitobacter alexandrii TaxID=1917485 RepID=A0A1J0WJT5_9RHOB|nr:phytanoyl-CoA dioxygenase family protein [Sulfitobacter alexandrii]APE44424.1 hypothetical protein BOO69_14150 [Sulfitobacter alexandrii]